MTSLAKKFFTPAEYLKFEEAALDKHEYYNGVVTERLTGSVNHHVIVGNLRTSFVSLFWNNPDYEIFGSDIRLQAKTKKFYTYPDLSVVLGKPKFTRTHPTAVLVNPILIVEVMFVETRAYDRGKKFDLYRAFPSLQAYVLVDSERSKNAPQENVSNRSRSPAGLAIF